MIITINNDEGNTLYDVNKISDESAKQEALDFASRTHRANLEELLKKQEEAIVEEPVDESLDSD